VRILVVGILCCISCAACANAFQPELSKGKICSLTVGDKIQDLLKVYKNTTVEKFMQEGETYSRYVFKINDCGTVKAILDSEDGTGSVWRLSTKSKKLMTKDGVKTGMTLNDLRSLYPEAELVFQWDGESLAYSFVLPDDEGVFEFDPSEIMDKCGDEHPNCEKNMKHLKSVRFFTY